MTPGPGGRLAGVRRQPVDAVGVVAGGVGLPALLALPFAVLRGSRIQTGVGVGLTDALGAPWAAVLVGVWVLLIALALRGGRGRRGAAARGLVAGVAVMLAMWLSGTAARELAAGGGPYARVSIGAGAWATMIAAYGVVLSARRQAGGVLGLGLSGVAPAGVGLLLLAGSLDQLGIVREYANQSDRFWTEVGAHVVLCGVSVAMALAIGGVLGVVAYRVPRLARAVFSTANLLQTIPGLAMIGLLVPVLAAISRAVPGLRSFGFGGLGWAPVVISLTLYGLLPVVRNVHAGLAGVPSETLEAGRGMGMSERQLLGRVLLPLAAPVALTGGRVAAVQALGNATLGAFAAAGTLGLFVFGGLAQQSTDLVLLGSLAIVSLAVVADGGFRLVAAAAGRRLGRERA